jgi:signal transduction histidine kinase
MLAAEKELLSTTIMSLAEGVIITNNDGMIILFTDLQKLLLGMTHKK